MNVFLEVLSCLDVWFAHLYAVSLRFNCRAWGNVARAVAWESADLAKKMTMLQTWKHSDGVSCQWRLEERKALVPCNEKLKPLEGMAQESLMRTEIAQMMDQLIPRRDIHTHTHNSREHEQNWPSKLIAICGAAMDEFRTVNVLLLHGLRGWGKRMVKRMQEILWNIGQDGLLLEYNGYRRIV